MDEAKAAEPDTKLVMYVPAGSSEQGAEMNVIVEAS